MTNPTISIDSGIATVGNVPEGMTVERLSRDPQGMFYLLFAPAQWHGVNPAEKQVLFYQGAGDSLALCKVIHCGTFWTEKAIEVVEIDFIGAEYQKQGITFSVAGTKLFADQVSPSGQGNSPIPLERLI